MASCLNATAGVEGAFEWAARPPGGSLDQVCDAPSKRPCQPAHFPDLRRVGGYSVHVTSPQAPRRRSAPPPVRRALRALNSVDLANLQGLVTKLKGSPVTSPHELAILLSDQLQVRPGPARQIASFLAAMASRQWADDDEQLEMFLSEAAAASDLEMDSDRTQVVMRLVALRPLALFARGVEMQYEYPEVLTGARILSDIRPIFTEDGDSSDQVDLLAATITHNLRLDFHGTEEPGSAFFALDRADLELLMEVVGRALAKHDSLVELLDKAAVQLVEPWKDRDFPEGD